MCLGVVLVLLYIAGLPFIGPGRKKRNTCDDIFEIARLKLAHKPLHAARFELEHGVRIPAADKVESNLFRITLFQGSLSLRRAVRKYSQRLFTSVSVMSARKSIFNYAELFYLLPC